MRKKIFAIMAVAVAMLAITSCNNTGNDTQGESIINRLFGNKTGVIFKEFTDSASIPLDSLSNESPKFTSKVILKVADSNNKEIEKRINKVITYRAFGYDSINVKGAFNAFAEEMRDEYMLLRPEYLNEKDVNNNSPWFNYNFDITGYDSRGYNNIINYTIQTIYFTGGNHGNEVYTLINFDPETGSEVTLQQLFNENYEEVLIDRLTNKLAQKIGATSTEDIQEKGYLLFNDMYITDNFLLEKDSMIFLYNNYDIAPYSQGKTRLAFSYNELKDIMKQ